MRAVVPIQHDGVRGLVAVGIIVEAIRQRVRDQLLVLIILWSVLHPAVPGGPVRGSVTI
jgi:sensor histidine kinase regulating citrate/malate metabolism